MIKFTVLCFFSTSHFFEVVSCATKYLYCPFTDPVISATDFSLVFVNYGDNVTIPCCQRYSEIKSKTWYKKDRFLKQRATELNDASKISSSYEYIIEYFTEENSGAYYCTDTTPDDPSPRYYYLIDVVVESPVIRGTRKGYLEYLQNYFKPIEEYLENYQNNDELLALHEQTGLTLSVNLRFDEWLPCNPCNKVKLRIGHCHLEPRVNRTDLCGKRCEIYKFALSVDCRATWSLNKVFPKLSQKIKQVPDFISIIKCVGDCASIEIPVDVHNKFKLRYVPAGSTLQLSCQDYSLSKKCHWTRDNVMLHSTPYDTDAVVSVNEFAVLFIRKSTTKESGNYICFLDGKLTTEYKVIVYEEASEKNAVWWRHMKYLMYIILLCFIVLIAGLVIGTLQRNSYQQIDVREAIEKFLLRKFDHEKIEPPDVSES